MLEIYFQLNVSSTGNSYNLLGSHQKGDNFNLFESQWLAKLNNGPMRISKLYDIIAVRLNLCD